MKIKRLMLVLLMFLVLVNGGWVHSSDVVNSPGDKVTIQNLEQVLVVTEQSVLVSFEVSPFRREETDKDGNGLRRYDQLIAEAQIRVYGENTYLWTGSLEDLDGHSIPYVIKPLVNPESDLSAVYIDIILEASSYPIKWSQGWWSGFAEKSWAESNDAGEYTAMIKTTVVYVQ
jgi:hypothetical protein